MNEEVLMCAAFFVAGMFVMYVMCRVWGLSMHEEADMFNELLERKVRKRKEHDDRCRAHRELDKELNSKGDWR